jgi:hypothetical protein
MRRVAVVGIALVAAFAGVWVASGRDEEPWPPKWYVDATANPEAHRAAWKRLRRRAINPPDTDFPPKQAKLEILRFQAVGASADPRDSRPKEARVYFSDRVSASSVIEGGSVLAGGASVYVLALRGKFTNADLRHPPATPPREGTSPMVIFFFDPATMHSTDFYQGREVDLSALGESIELDLSQEPG